MPPRYRNRYAYKPRSVRRLERRSRKNLLVLIFLTLFLGYAMLNWGLPALVNSLGFLNKFKQTPKQESVQIDEAIAPPVLNIPFESTNSATIKITGYATANSKVEIYIDDEIKSTPDSNSEGNFSSEQIPLSIGINNIYGKTIDEKGKKSLPSKNIKVIYSNEKPRLEVTEPSDGQQIKGGDKKVKVSGKTDIQNNITINGVNVILNSDGTFIKELEINEGDTNIEIIAINTVGSTTKIGRRVNYSP